MNWFKRKETPPQPTVVSQEVLDLRASLNAATQCAANQVVEIEQLKKRLQEEETERAQLKSKLRDQTEADLVLVSLKIVYGAIAGKTRAELSPLNQQQALLQQQAAQYEPYNGFFGFGGGSLGSLLGNYHH